MQLGPTDIHRKQQVIAFGSSVKGGKEEEEKDYVQDLLSEGATAWDELINHPFPVKLAKGTAALNGFRHYMTVSKTTRISHRGISSSTHSKMPHT